MAFLRTFLKKNSDILLYFFFGVATTLVNYAVYLPMYHWFHLPGALSNVVAWMIAVMFAFLTNKPFVFKSKDWSKCVVIPELIRFLSSRGVSGTLETVYIAVTVDILAWNGIWMKLIGSVIVIILNYVFSRVFVFRMKG